MKKYWKKIAIVVFVCLVEAALTIGMIAIGVVLESVGFLIFGMICLATLYWAMCYVNDTSVFMGYVLPCLFVGAMLSVNLFFDNRMIKLAGWISFAITLLTFALRWGISVLGKDFDRAQKRETLLTELQHFANAQRETPPSCVISCVNGYFTVALITHATGSLRPHISHPRDRRPLTSFTETIEEYDEGVVLAETDSYRGACEIMSLFMECCGVMSNEIDYFGYEEGMTVSGIKYREIVQCRERCFRQGTDTTGQYFAFRIFFARPDAVPEVKTKDDLEFSDNDKCISRFYKVYEYGGNE